MLQVVENKWESETIQCYPALHLSTFHIPKAFWVKGDRGIQAIRQALQKPLLNYRVMRKWDVPLQCY